MRLFLWLFNREINPVKNSFVEIFLYLEDKTNTMKYFSFLLLISTLSFAQNYQQYVNPMIGNRRARTHFSWSYGAFRNGTALS
jgi:hypothetical protein